MLRHVVLFRVYDEVDDESVAAALARLRMLASVVGAVSWHVELSTDTRKGRVIVEDATFASEADFAAFRAHPAHRAAGAEMAAIADWWIGDYVL